MKGEVEMAHKFQIGDMVQVVPGAIIAPDWFAVGHRGVVKDFILNHQTFPYLVERKNGNTLYFNAKELKLVKRKTKKVKV